jgi:arylsulfatase A-like enzyme
MLMASSLPAIGLSTIPYFRPTPSGPNIVLIVLDTARPDRMSLYGYARPTTPSLESLAQQSTVYTQAYSTSSWTPPSHASLFTGQLPCDHGVTHAQATHPPKLPERSLALAEILWESGYRTAAIVGNAIMPSWTGFSQGFDQYHETWRMNDRNLHPAERLFEEFVQAESERPYFVFINLIEPHSPYDSSGEFFGLYDRHPELGSLVDSDWAKHLTEQPYSVAELEHFSDLYDSEIQQTDAIVGRVLQQVRDRGVLDETLVIVTADHGEHFGEHGLVEHILNLYETNVRVPLLIRYPPRWPPGLRDSSLVQLQDLFETVKDIADAGKHHPSQGFSLLDRDGVPEQRLVFFEYHQPWKYFESLGYPPQLERFQRDLQAVRNGSLKLIVGSDSTTELYDVVRDPLEQEDLSGRPEYANDVKRLKTLLQARFAACLTSTEHGSAPIELDEETLQELKSLGYIQ